MKNTYLCTCTNCGWFNSLQRFKCFSFYDINDDVKFIQPELKPNPCCAAKLPWRQSHSTEIESNLRLNYTNPKWQSENYSSVTKFAFRPTQKGISWINLCFAAVRPNSRVWVLDRRAFQQIMMRTGLQRIEENVRFLKSVPLLHHLDNDVLAKIADVLELVSACFLLDFLPGDKKPELVVNKLTDAELYWIIHGWLLRKVNLQSCSSLFTYSFKYLEPLEAHFRFLSYLRFRWRHQDSPSQAKRVEKKRKGERNMEAFSKYLLIYSNN